MNRMHLNVRALHPLFAGEVHGLDLGERPRPELVAAIESLMDELAVLVIRDQTLNDEQHIALSRAFGPLELPPDYLTGAPRRLRPELYDASNLDADGNILAQDSPRREYNKANSVFHADSTFNDLWHSRPGGEHFKVTDKMRRLMPAVEHNLVTVLPDGRNALCIGSHASHVVGMSVEAGRKLLAGLYEFATQAKYIYTHAWRSGDLIVWDNRRALHRASPWQDNGQIRDMRRTTLLERGLEISATSRY